MKLQSKLILASTSPYRKKQMKDLGVSFSAHSPLSDEDQLKRQNPNLSPYQLSRHLARQKAQSLKKRYPKATIIGADQLVELDGQILGKPHTVKKACQMLKKMSGKTHRLITSVCVVSPRGTQVKTVVAKITLRKISKTEIQQYVQQDEPLDCAGSYKFELSGYTLVDRIRVSDPSSLIGLPLMALSQMLRRLD